MPKAFGRGYDASDAHHAAHASREETPPPEIATAISASPQGGGWAACCGDGQPWMGGPKSGHAVTTTVIARLDRAIHAIRSGAIATPAARRRHWHGWPHQVRP
jgi:hypothetical protein